MGPCRNWSTRRERCADTAGFWARKPPVELFVALAVSFLLAPAPPLAAVERLDEVLAAMKAAGDRLSTLQARFEQTNNDYILNEKEVTSGKLCFKTPGQIRWEYDPPQRKVLLVTDEKVQLYNPVSNQLQVFKKGQMRGAGADLLIGFGKSNAEIGKNYDVTLTAEDSATVTLKLVPKPGSTATIFSAIELTVEKKRWIPVRSLFHEPNRDTAEIVFEEIQVNGALPSRAFELDLPPNVEIIRSGP